MTPSPDQAGRLLRSLLDAGYSAADLSASFGLRLDLIARWAKGTTPRVCVHRIQIAHAFCFTAEHLLARLAARCARPTAGGSR